MEKRSLRKRKATRFKAAPGTLVQVSLASTSKNFKPQVIGLAIDEAYKGGSFVTIADKRLSIGANLYVKVGRVAALKAQVRWVKELEYDLCVYGMEFLE